MCPPRCAPSARGIFVPSPYSLFCPLLLGNRGPWHAALLVAWIYVVVLQRVARCRAAFSATSRQKPKPSPVLSRSACRRVRVAPVSPFVFELMSNIHISGRRRVSATLLPGCRAQHAPKRREWQRPRDAVQYDDDDDPQQQIRRKRPRFKSTVGGASSTRAACGAAGGPGSEFDLPGGSVQEPSRSAGSRPSCTTAYSSWAGARFELVPDYPLPPAGRHYPG